MKKLLIFSAVCLVLAGCEPAGTRSGSNPIAIATATPLVTPTVPAVDAPGAGQAANLVPIAPTAMQPPLATQPPALPAMPGLAFPVRAAFYYPWFPESWKQSGMDPFTHYQPTLGFYSEDDPAVIQHQVAAMQYGKIQLGIASWWGQGHYTDNRFPALLQAGEKAGFYWAAYMESEGQGNPSVEAIRSDLAYIHDHYASSPAYLKIGGRVVIFVYADPVDGCNMAYRWTQANSVGAYLVLKVFTGYRNCASQPDAWHQYAPDGSQKSAGKMSFMISPGFWKASEAQLPHQSG